LAGPELAGVAALLGNARQVLKLAGHSTEGAEWGLLLDDALVSALAAGREDEARERVKRWLDDELNPIDDGAARIRG
jgi:hypothetical protein